MLSPSILGIRVRCDKPRSRRISDFHVGKIKKRLIEPLYKEALGEECLSGKAMQDDVEAHARTFVTKKTEIVGKG